MEFVEFRDLLQKHVDTIITSDVQNLFIVNVDKEVLWNLYLDSFPEGTNEVFRKRREFDCSCCRHFMKAFGNVVVIKDSKIVTIWDFQTGDTTYQPVIDVLSKFIKSHTVSDVFVSKFSYFGTKSNFENNDAGVITWNHLYVDNIPPRFVTMSTTSEASQMGAYRDIRNVFQRSLSEISEDAILTILELISQKSLYKGEEWEGVLKQFLVYHKEYHKLKKKEKDNYCWVMAGKVGGAIGKIRNHSIGLLLTDISEGVDLDAAVRKYETIVAPSNYKRPKAIYSAKMLKESRKKLEDLGLMSSLARRYATIDDITVNNILFANRDIPKNVSNNVFDKLYKDISISPKLFSKTEEVSIDTFIKDILPNASMVKVLLENRHSANLVSLIAPTMDSKTMFKWSNNFSWAYRGNITDSMKERVKAAGGNVDGVLRFSLQWNDNGDNNNDFDAHCHEPNGNHIYFQNKGVKHISSGMLDVDIMQPRDNIAVENIIYTSLKAMPDGLYEFRVHNYNHRGGRSGFSAELEFDDQIFSFNYDRELIHKETISVVSVMYNRRDGFKIVKSLPSSVSSMDLWGLKTNQFYPVSVCMLSPNYWDKQKGVGNKHYFFMIDGCKNNENPNGFFNEFLQEEFMQYKGVFEALGSEMRVEDDDNQLSGLGFSSTQRNSIIVTVEGHFTRTLKVVF